MNKWSGVVRRKRFGVQAGTAFVEFALIIVVVITLVGALIEYGLSIQAGQAWSEVAQFVARSITREFEGMTTSPLCSEVVERAQQKLDVMVSSLAPAGYLVGYKEGFKAIASSSTHTLAGENDPSLSKYEFIRIEITRAPTMFFGQYIPGSPEIHVESVGRIDCS